ncbi:MAG: FtsW/RodA/SpoVE family cell cycle protein, partial [Acidobacteriaceae bacterium]
MRRFLSYRDFDWTLMAFVLALSIISVLEIYSATLHTKFVNFDQKQMLWLAGGFASMFILSLIDYHILLDIAVWAYGICLVALLAVLAVGTKVLGGRRWISLPGGIHFQPSEWVKLVLIVVLARFFTNLGGRDLTWKDIFKAILMVVIPMLLVMKQPDLGTALTYAPVLLCGLFLGGIRFKHAAILFLAASLALVPAWHKVLK